MARWLSIVCVVAWSAGLAWAAAPAPEVPPPTELTYLQLNDGTLLTGRFALQHNGVVQFTGAGGRLYAWDRIALEYLPATVRAAQRAALMQTLAAAQALYAQDRVAEAQPLFQQVLAGQAFLNDADRQLPSAADLELKARGYVQHEGAWMPFAERQQRRGLVWYNSSWLPAAKVEQLRQVKDLLARAAAAKDKQQAAIDLKLWQEQHPDSPFTEMLNETIKQLLAAALAPPPAPAPAPAPATPKVQDRLDQYYDRGRSYGISDGYVTTVRDDGIPDRPRYVYDRDGFRLIYPGSPWGWGGGGWGRDWHSHRHSGDWRNSGPHDGPRRCDDAPLRIRIAF